MRATLCSALLMLVVVAPSLGQDDAEKTAPDVGAAVPAVPPTAPDVEAIPVQGGEALAGDPVAAVEGGEVVPGDLVAPAEEAVATGVTPAAPELDELLRQMGAPPEAALFFKMLAQQDMDPMTMILLMAMMDGGNIDDDFIGFMLFSKMMQQGAKTPPAPPPTMLHGNTLIIVDDGTAYLLDAETLALRGQLEYQPKAKQADPLETILPMLMQFRDVALQREAQQRMMKVGTTGVRGPRGCEGNLRRLYLAATQYAADNQNTLPGVDWPVTLAPYVRDTDVYQCPAVPELAVAFVINEAVAGLKVGDIADPGQAVLFFESDLGTDLPIGGPEALVENARHEGKVAVGFVDGNTAMMTLEEARALLEGAALAGGAVEVPAAGG